MGKGTFEDELHKWIRRSEVALRRTSERNARSPSFELRMPLAPKERSGEGSCRPHAPFLHRLTDSPRRCIQRMLSPSPYRLPRSPSLDDRVADLPVQVDHQVLQVPQVQVDHRVHQVLQVQADRQEHQVIQFLLKRDHIGQQQII